MLKLMILGRRAPGASRAQAQHHLREVHGRLVLLPPPDAGAMPADYVQNHVIDGVYPSGGPHGIERDLFTEIWFGDIAALQASTSTPYYLATLKPDEPKFVDDATVAKMLVREERLVNGERGRFKAFIIVGAGEATNGAFSDLVQHLAATPGLGALTANHVLPPPDGSPRFADVIYECWFIDENAARRVIEQARATLSDGSMRHARSMAMLAKEYDSAWLKDRYRLAAS